MWAVLFTDIVGSTAHRVRLGEAAGDAFVRDHDEIVKRCLGTHGVFVKGTGDGAMVAFQGAAHAVHGAVSIQRSIAHRNRRAPESLQVRIGISLGDLAGDGDDLHGLAAHEAARICAVAQAGEILVSDIVRTVAGSRLEVHLAERGWHELKGLGEPIRLWAVDWEAPEDTAPEDMANHGPAIRIILADDDLLLRTGVQQVLASIAGVKVVAAVGDYESLLAAINEHPAELVLTDIRMPPGGNDEGIRVAEQLRVTHPEMGVIVLSKYDDPPYAVALLDKGSRGRGYLLKERVSDPRQLESAIREVAGGGSVIDPLVVDNLMRARTSARTSLIATLTPQEKEVLGELAQGKKNQAIAESLRLDERTVDKHVKSIFAKLGLRGDSTAHHRVRAALIYLSEER